MSKIDAEDLGTKEVDTWCPGCTNHGILMSVKKAFANLINNGIVRHEDVVVVSGVGCHDKIYDYLNFNGFHALHGRSLPVMLGLKIANPELKVIGFGGDGAVFAEGISHFIHACRYNADETFILHNNKLFALTTGQATPLTEKGFKTPSTPLGVNEEPINPIVVALISGATFVARAYAMDIEHLTEIIEAAVKHRGFAFIDVIQPCIAFKDIRKFIEKHIYKIKNHDAGNFNEALKKAGEWKYTLNEDDKIPVGIFYKTDAKVFEEKWKQLKEAWYRVERNPDYKEILNEYR